MIVGRYFCQLLAMCWKKVLRKQQEGFGHAGSARHVQILEKEDSSKVGRSMNLENFMRLAPNFRLRYSLASLGASQARMRLRRKIMRIRRFVSTDKY